MNLKLSIVVPVYNVESYLSECLESLLNQRFKNIEIIVVNDCSPDNSEEIILRYQEKDSRIKYIKHTENLGLGGARNTGVKYASAEWITFVDSDDWVDVHCYENLMNALEKNPNANLALFAITLIDDQTKQKFFDSYFDVQDLNDPKWFWNQCVTVPNKIFRKQDLLDYELFFPEHLKHEDEEFWAKYCLSVPIVPIGDNRPYYCYRQRINSITSNRASKKDLPKIAFNIYEFAKKRNLLETKKHFICGIFNKFTYVNFDADQSFLVEYFAQLKIVLDHLSLNNEELLYLDFFTQNLYLLKDSSYIPFFLEHFQKIDRDKWYCFGRLSKKKKIKKILVVLLKKMKIYAILKKFLKK
ncbi:MAG: glycosyltransferase family 2 protein [Brevinema sp.]